MIRMGNFPRFRFRETLFSRPVNAAAVLRKSSACHQVVTSERMNLCMIVLKFENSIFVPYLS